MIRRLSLAAVLLLLLVGGIVYAGYRNARADPVVRRASVALPGWPAGAAPVDILLLSDIHLESATMDEGRLARIVAQVNALHPDLIVMAGDFVEGYGRAGATEAAPILARRLRRLRAPLGVVAVLGNHDYGTDPVLVERMLARIGVVVLHNQARAFGPLALAGLDDEPSDHARLPRTMAALARVAGARVMIAHSPEIGYYLPADVGLLLTGHTHCGQVVLPIVGAPVEVVSKHYRCGVVRDPGRVTIVTAGLGTSDLPVRYGAPPDMWVVRVGPAR